MAEQHEKTDIMVIRDYFFQGEPAQTVMKEVKALSAEERKQLADGIRNGSLTY